MIYSDNRSALTAITNTLDELHLTMPAEAQARLDTARALRRVAGKTSTTRTSETVQAMRGELAADTLDPGSVIGRLAEAVAVDQAASEARKNARSIAELADGHVVAAIRRHSDDLVEQYREQFDQAAGVIRQAVAAGVRPDDPHPPFDLQRLEQAEAVLNGGIHLLDRLAERTRPGPTVAYLIAETIGGVEHPQAFEYLTPLDRSDIIFNKPATVTHSVVTGSVAGPPAAGYIGLVMSGYTLRLNTLDEGAALIEKDANLDTTRKASADVLAADDRRERLSAAVDPTPPRAHRKRTAKK